MSERTHTLLGEAITQDSVRAVHLSPSIVDIFKRSIGTDTLLTDGIVERFAGTHKRMDKTGEVCRRCVDRLERRELFLSSSEFLHGRTVKFVDVLFFVGEDSMVEKIVTLEALLGMFQLQ